MVYIIYTYIYLCNGKLKKEILAFAATWIDLKYTMLNEISQKQKNKHYTISFMCRIKTVEFTEAESSGCCQGIEKRRDYG